MAKQEKTAPPATSAPGSGNAWAKIQAEAAERPDIFPRLEFGDDKMAEVTHVVTFLEDEPRLITFKDKYNGDADTPGLAINVSMRETGESRSIIMRDDANHGLTAGIGKIAARNGGKLSGVTVRIETKNYRHKQYGPTRGYVVTVVPNPDGKTASPP